jgi:uncharacterized lipoprotein YmbA
MARPGRWLLLPSAILWFACSASPPLHYYTLDTVAGSSVGGVGHAAPVWIARVTLPRQLDRPQMVRRAGPNRLDFDEENRWAAPLSSMFTSILAQDLADRMPPGQVIAPGQPLPAGNVRQLTVDVITFESDLQGHVVLDAGWTLEQGAPPRVVMRRTARISASAASGASADVAAAMSQALGQLADRIAASLGGAPAG